MSEHRFRFCTLTLTSNSCAPNVCAKPRMSKNITNGVGTYGMNGAFVVARRASAYTLFSSCASNVDKSLIIDMNAVRGSGLLGLNSFASRFAHKSLSDGSSSSDAHSIQGKPSFNVHARWLSREMPAARSFSCDALHVASKASALRAATYAGICGKTRDSPAYTSPQISFITE